MDCNKEGSCCPLRRYQEETHVLDLYCADDSFETL